MHSVRIRVSCFVVVLVALINAIQLRAQTHIFDQQVSRASQMKGANNKTVRGGNLPDKRLAAYDKGLESPGRVLYQMRLILKPSPETESAMLKFLDEQRTPTSPNFHKWLTPDEFARRFGASRASIDKATTWLNANGMTEIELSRGHRSISFSGPVLKVSSAFKTDIHTYNVNGTRHFANILEPAVPSELSDAIFGINGLNDLKPAPQVTKFNPQYAWGGGINFMGPDDLATMYDIKPLYAQGIDGRGITIAVPGAALIDLKDYQSYRSLFGLGPNDYQVIAVPNGQDNLAPSTSMDGLEATLDLQIAGAIARNATILYIQDDNVVVGAQYVIDNQLAQIITFSYGACETESSTDHMFYQAMAQQANAEGITWAAASGDLGPANCDWTPEPEATQGLAVLVPASVPEITAVGGTRVTDGSSSEYWSATNNSTGGSLLSYVPETTWNASESGGGGGSMGPTASGGGISAYFPKPGFQAGLGDPSIRKRMVPDVSLNASDGYAPDAIFYGGWLGSVGGTSAATPAFSGMLALVENYLLVHNSISVPGIGNANPTLYNVNANVPSAFHDIITDDNDVDCVIGTPDCTTGRMGYPATAGYDLATGLGSVDLYVLSSNWANYQAASSTTTLSADITSVTARQNLTFSTQTISDGGSPQNGIVTLRYKNPANYYGLTQSDNAGPIPVTSTADTTGAAVITTNLLPAGVNTVSANFGGTASVNSSMSNTLTIRVNAFPTTTTATPASTSAPTGQKVSIAVSVVDARGESPIGPVSQPGTQGFIYLGRDSGPFVGSLLLPESGTTTMTTPPLVHGANTFVLDFAGTAFAAPSLFWFVITGTERIATNTTVSATFQGGPVSAVVADTNVTLTATVVPSAGGPTPTGTVRFMDGMATLGLGTLDGASRAVLTTSNLSEGVHAITATYAGDNTYAVSTSSSLQVTVQDFMLPASNPGMTITVGLSQSAQIAVTPQSGFTGTVNFSCVVPSTMSEASCSSTAAQITGTSMASSTLTVNTTAAHRIASIKRHSIAFLAMNLSFVLGAFFWMGTAKCGRRMRIISCVLLSLSMLGAVACGGGGGSTPPPGMVDQGTAPGTYILTLTGTSGSVRHMIEVSVTVQ